MSRSLEKRAERAVIFEEIKALVEKTEKEKRDFNAEEKASYEKMSADIDRLEVEAKEIEARDAKIAALKASMAGVGNREVVGSVENADSGDQKELRAFRAYLKDGEKRDLTASSFGEGGAIIAPRTVVNELVKALAVKNFIRQSATVYQLAQSVSLGVPTLESGASSPEWTSEIPASDIAADSSMAFGGRELKPTRLAKLVKMSYDLLRYAVLNPETIVNDELARVYAEAEENGFINGNGASQPLGCAVVSPAGVTAARKVQTGNTTTAITFDGLYEAKYALKEGYFANAKWLFHPDALKALRKIKDANGQYLWTPGVVANASDTLYGHPVMSSTFCPHTFTTGLVVGVFADFSKYWIADALDLTVQRLNELYALRNKTGFLAKKSTDGMPVLAEAFSLVTLA